MFPPVPADIIPTFAWGKRVVPHRYKASLEPMTKLHVLIARAAACAALVAGAFAAYPAAAQVPIPMREQIELFQSLPPAQQQGLIRELQRNLPPAQRQAIVNMLLEESGLPATGRDTDMPAGADALGAGGSPATGFGELDLEAYLPIFEPGDWLVIEFSEREGAQASLTNERGQRLTDFLRRLQDGNPFQLDASGRLLLPGVPAIALAGLNVDEATVRIRAEPALRPFDIVVTRLPLRPVGTAALEPFGYDLFERQRSAFQPRDDVPVPTGYVVGPGDSVNVQLFGNQNDEFFLTVNRDGIINFPGIGPINVSGLTFDALRDTINTRVSEQLIGVRASITLGELRSIRVFVLGDVRRPGSYLVGGFSTMMSALYAAGGIAEIGSLRNVSLLRDGQTVGTLDIYDLLLRGDTAGDLRLQPGDAVFVPPVGATVAVDGEVRRPAIYEIRNERTITELIAMAGGFRPNADRSAIKLERVVPSRGMTVQDVDLSADASAITIRDGDTVRVLANLEQLENAVRLTGNVYNEGVYQWYSGMRLSDLLPSPERVRPMSDLNYVLIRREVAPNINMQVISADLNAIWRREPGAIDPVLEPRDTIYVFNLEIGRQPIIEPIIQELQAQTGSNEPFPIARVAGQVRAAGAYPLEPGMRVSDLIRAGGGLTASAYSLEAELTRYLVVDGEYRQTELITVDMGSLLRGDAQTDLLIAPYDYLFIKEVPRWRSEASVSLRGEVLFPGTYQIREGETLSSVLRRAGGLTPQAFPQGSVFTRVELQQREREQLETLARRIEADLASLSLSDPLTNDAMSVGQSLLTQLRNATPTGRLVIRLDEIVAGVAERDVLLRDGDELFVPPFRQEVTVLGEVQYPTSHLFEAGLARNDYLDRSGGLTRRADERRIYVVRANGEVVADGGGRWFRRTASAQIEPGDTIVVPLDVERTRPLARWSSITQVVYNLAIAAAAVNSF